MARAYIAPEDQAFGISLLDRLNQKIEITDFHNKVGIEQVLQSIKSNLARVLNTRTNSNKSTPHLGLVDFNDNQLCSTNMALRIKLNIQNCITRFEPRLRAVSVQALSNEYTPSLMNFAVVAELNTESLHESVQFQLMIDKKLQYRVL